MYPRLFDEDVLDGYRDDELAKVMQQIMKDNNDEDWEKVTTDNVDDFFDCFTLPVEGCTQGIIEALQKKNRNLKKENKRLKKKNKKLKKKNE